MSHWRERSQGSRAVIARTGTGRATYSSERIELRFDQRARQRFLDEVEALYQRGDLHVDLPL